MADHLFERVMQLAEDGQGRGDYDVAYHLLMAALHIADKRRDADALDRLARVALRYEAGLEGVRPPHPLSRQRAEERGQTSVFDSLRVHVDAVRARLKGVQIAPR